MIFTKSDTQQTEERNTCVNKAIIDDRPSLAMTHLSRHVFIITHVSRRGVVSTLLAYIIFCSVSQW